MHLFNRKQKISLSFAQRVAFEIVSNDTKIRSFRFKTKGKLGVTIKHVGYGISTQHDAKGSVALTRIQQRFQSTKRPGLSEAELSFSSRGYFNKSLQVRPGETFSVETLVIKS